MRLLTTAMLLAAIFGGSSAFAQSSAAYPFA